jgi:hypothetical protein
MVQLGMACLLMNESALEAAKKNKRIEREINVDKENKRRTVKLLLQGTPFEIQTKIIKIINKFIEQVQKTQERVHL